MKGLYVITDCDRLAGASLLSVTEEILQAGVTALQYRDKSAGDTGRKCTAAALSTLCREYGCLFIVNDDVQLAKSTGSDGVHLGQGDVDCKTARKTLGEEAIIGVSCYNSLDLARTAATDGADYVAFGSFYPTSSKRNTVTAEPAIIKQAKASLSLPVAAIGGITPANCPPLLARGADMLAVISSIYRAKDPTAAVEEFNRVIRRSMN